MIDQYIDKLKMSWCERGITVFFAVLSLFCLLLGSCYWVRLIGVYNETLWRYDLMPWNWRILCCSLAILYPIAACGLWMGSKWGIIVWLLGGLIEAICYTFYASYFEFHLAVPFLHVLFFIIYVILTFLKIKKGRKLQEIVVEY